MHPTVDLSLSLGSVLAWVTGLATLVFSAGRLAQVIASLAALVEQLRDSFDRHCVEDDARFLRLEDRLMDLRK